MAKRIKTGEEATGGKSEKVAQWAQYLDEHDHGTDANGKNISTEEANRINEQIKLATMGKLWAEAITAHKDRLDFDTAWTEAYMDKALWESGYLAGQIDERARWTPQPDIPFSEPPSGKLPPNEEEGYCPEYDEGYGVGYADGVRDITHGNIRHQLLDLFPPFDSNWEPWVKSQWLQTWAVAYMKGDQP